MKYFVLILLLFTSCGKSPREVNLTKLTDSLPAVDKYSQCGIRYRNSLYDGNYSLIFNVKLVSRLGTSTEVVDSIQTVLNRAFKAYGISFQVTKEHSFFFTKEINSFKNDLEEYAEDGYITIILYSDSESPIMGVAGGVPTEVLGIQERKVASTTLIHEMGHVLGLHHTFTPDHTNGKTHTYGDLICDTPSFDAMSYQTRNCIYIGEPVYSEEDLKIIIPNYLSYNTQLTDCRSSFTPLQGLAMRWHIENFPYLRNALK